jgi:RNA polymerase sigma factor (sigma-70 family)
MELRLTKGVVTMSGADSVLLRRWLADGDAEAFDEIVQRHVDMVYATSWRIVRDRADAEDVVQDCFLRLAGAARDIRTSLGGWLHAAAVSRSLDVIKRDSRRRERERRFAERQGQTKEIVWDDIEEVIDEAIAALPDDLRTLVVAHYLERQTHEAIARETGIPRRTVSHRIGLGVEAIRKNLAQRGIVAGSVALTAALSTPVVEAAPTALAASLGKIAMSGVRHAASGGLNAATLSGGTLLSGKGILAALALVVAAGTWYLVQTNMANPEAAIPPTESEPQALAVAVVQEPVTSAAQEEQVAENLPVETVEEPGLIEDPSQYITVSGLVKDGADRPLAGAKVLLAVTSSAGRIGEDMLRENYLRRSRVYEASSDALGQYEVSDIRHEGQALLCAVVPNYASNRQQFDMKAGESFSDKDLSLTDGITVQGALSAEDGTMVTDAIVSTHHAWNRSGYAWGWGFNVTDEHGLFTLSFAPDAQWTSLRVNSAAMGQDYFFRLPVHAGNFELRMKPKASLHGTITWNGERPSEEVVLSLLGEVPEPDMNTWYSGSIPSLQEFGVVGADDTFRLKGLYPGLRYRLFVTKNEADKHPSIRAPLAKIEQPPLVFEPGEDKELNLEVGEPIVVKGRVLTEKTRQPVPGSTLLVEKVAPPPARHAGAANVGQDGTFTFQSGDGPGTYRFTIMDLGPTTGEFREQLADSPGARLQLAAGEARETEILVPEPTLFTIRVVDHAGSSPNNVETVVHIVGRNGQEGGRGAYIKLDEMGRYTYSIYEPIQEVWVDVGKGLGAGMPRTESDHLAVEPRETLPELLIVLEPTCTLTGIVRDPQGNKLANQSVTLKGTYDDAESNRIQSYTDKDGRFECKDGFLTGVVTFSIRADRGTWESEPIECAPDDIVDLDEIVLSP